MISTRRAVLMVLAPLFTLPGTVWLLGHGKPGEALLSLLLFTAYAVVELVAGVRRDRCARRRYWAGEHSAAGPLTGYCPQVDDRLFSDFERHGRSA